MYYIQWIYLRPFPNLLLDVLDNPLNNIFCSRRRQCLGAFGNSLSNISMERRCSLQLILPAPSPLSRTETWLTIPLALWRGSHPDAGVVEPFVGAVLVVTGHHVPVGNLVADAVSWLVGIIIPFLVWTLAGGMTSTTKTCHWGWNAGQGRRSSNLKMQDSTPIKKDRRGKP